MSAFHGQFVWHELMTTDLGAAETFYGSVVGWTLRDSGMTEMRYTIGSVGEAPVVGMMTAPPDMIANGGRPGWLGYIGVDDVDVSAAALTNAGGAVHRPGTDIPNVGRFAVVSDPQGAVFVLFTPMGEGGPRPEPRTPGTTGWNELHAGDWPSAFAFYSGLFGWAKGNAVDMGPMGTYQLFTAGDGDIGGMMNKMASAPRPAWTYYFTVEDINAAAARVTDGGGKVVNGPHPVPGGSFILHGIDPQGAFFALTAGR